MDGTIQDDPTSPASVRIYGTIIESAGFVTEGPSGTKPIDTSCVKDFEPLIASYDLESKFQALEGQAAQSAYYGEDGEVDEASKQQLWVDLDNFKREFKVFFEISPFPIFVGLFLFPGEISEKLIFQGTMSCVLDSRFGSGKRQLNALLDLYLKAANIRFGQL